MYDIYQQSVLGVKKCKVNNEGAGYKTVDKNLYARDMKTLTKKKYKCYRE